MLEENPDNISTCETLFKVDTSLLFPLQAPNKMWFLFVTASILIFQCITTIVYVTAHKVYTPGNTLAPAFTEQAASTIKPITKPPGLSLTEASDSILAPPR